MSYFGDDNLDTDRVEITRKTIKVGARTTTIDGKPLEGRKDDNGKLPYHLLPSDAIEEIVKVLQYGSIKYEPRNWEKGMAWSRPFSALMRHMWAWWRGDSKDLETGYSHLAHAGCCLLFLLAYEKRRTGEDDRP